MRYWLNQLCKEVARRLIKDREEVSILRMRYVLVFITGTIINTTDTVSWCFNSLLLPWRSGTITFHVEWKFGNLTSTLLFRMAALQRTSQSLPLTEAHRVILLPRPAPLYAMMLKNWQKTLTYLHPNWTKQDLINHHGMHPSCLCSFTVYMPIF